jgi:hypothetical protein
MNDVTVLPYWYCVVSIINVVLQCVLTVILISLFIVVVGKDDLLNECSCGSKICNTDTLIP